MSLSATIAVQTLRAEQRRLRQTPRYLRLWQAMRGEWLRMRDRATAEAVNGLGHAGVIEDFRTACRGH